MRLLSLMLTLLAISAVHAGPPGGHRFDEIEKWVERFEPPERARWQKMNVVSRVLGLRPGMKVAEIGAGTGYVTLQLSMAVQDEGQVYAVDIEQGMLDHIAQRKDFRFDNVVTVLGEPRDPKLPDATMDLVISVNTWHHIERRKSYIAKLARALRPDGGRIVVIDWMATELPMGPPVEQKLSRDTVVREFAKAGWKLTTESVALPYQYFLVFGR